MPKLNTDIKFLKGVGEKKASLLRKELNIETIEDLLFYFPYKYIDKTRFHTISEINGTSPYIQIIGTITGFRVEGEKRRQRLIATFEDETGRTELVWFQGVKWVQNSLTIGTKYVIYGKPNVFNRKINIPHPDIEVYGQQESGVNSALESAYNTTEKMKKGYLNSKALHKLQKNALSVLEEQIPESLPGYLIEKHKLISLHDAIVNIHFPADSEALQKALHRLKFEELFYIQLKILRQKFRHTKKYKGFVFTKVGEFFNTFYKNNLPFELTNAQKRVLKEIRRDFGSGKHTNRLLQGDVGSGKTLVALMSMLIALDNGFQATLMAPTEILAQQHFETITDFLKGLSINIELLTGTTRKKKRTEIHEKLLSGEIHILIGTHALIEDVVQFKNLGVAIIDEQHRFGVAQRAKIWTKNTNPPHVIVMTATPIPRTLAMTVYGDLEVSVIDELPPGRKPVQTLHGFDSKRSRLFGFMRKQIKLGRQIYVVYPLIKESEKMDYKDLEDGYESISRAFPPPDYLVTIVHGKMKADDKERSMQLFSSGQSQILVATTVIEVGVNVPNASVMIIESAERFGLSQLHQLRGRVGRGADQSYCILMTSYKLSKEAKVRLETMVRTNDGFEIAEADMKLRGPGDMEGTQQSGLPFELKVANLAKDGQMLQYARDIAQKILEDDPDLKKEKNAILVKQLKKLSRFAGEWSDIS